MSERRRRAGAHERAARALGGSRAPREGRCRAPIERWPTPVEICSFQRHTRDLPKVRVANVRVGAG
jgi:hypothetical protein